MVIDAWIVDSNNNIIIHLWSLRVQFNLITSRFVFRIMPRLWTKLSNKSKVSKSVLLYVH